ncbi:hypothetical protein K8R04_04290 [Candidatus Uhrbacteria bacterium]|nr:hypothetical protein [Candidatus Uhrbacteria bacterium]
MFSIERVARDNNFQPSNPDGVNMSNFRLKLDALAAIISNPDGRTVREGMVQQGECPAFNRGEVSQTLELKGESDPTLFRAAFIVVHLSGGGCPYRMANWALVVVSKRLNARKHRRTEAYQEAMRLGAKPEQLRRMSTEEIFDRCEQEIGMRQAAFFSKMQSTVRSINVYEKAMQAKLTVVGVEANASKQEMEARYADLQDLLLTVQVAATKPKAKEPRAVTRAA